MAQVESGIPVVLLTLLGTELLSTFEETPMMNFSSVGDDPCGAQRVRSAE